MSARASIAQGSVQLVECMDQSFCDVLRQRNYLTDNIIEPLEAMLQAVRGRLEVENIGTGWQAFLAIATLLNVELKLAIVYLDLRKRYPEVRKGPRPDTLLARGKRGRPLEVLVLEEGEEVTVSQLGSWSTAASGDGHDPVVAVVDRNGQVTYYEARTVTQLF